MYRARTGRQTAPASGGGAAVRSSRRRAEGGRPSAQLPDCRKLHQAARGARRRMFPFWKLAIAPVLEAVRPRCVVEIGALRGETTTLMLEGLGADSELHVID